MLSTEEFSRALSGIDAIAFDFDGVFTDNTVYVDQNGKETVRCWRSDGLGLSRVQAQGILTVILSTEKNPVVGVRAAKLNIPCLQGLADKKEGLNKWCEQNSLSPQRVLFVGNDINDIPAMETAGLSAAVADCHPDILPLADFQTKAPGGRGAVREICDIFSASRS